MSRLYVDRISPYESASVTVDGLDTSNLTSKTTFNSYTSSNDAKVTSLINATGSFVNESETGSFASTNVANTFTTGPQIVSGSSSNTYFQSSFDTPTNSQILFFKAPNANVGGTAYPLTQFGFANYLGFGNEYSSSFLFESIRAAFRGGAALGISGKEVFIQMRSVGEAFAQRARIRMRDVDSGDSELSIDANTIDIGTGANTSNLNLASGFIKTNVAGVLNIGSKDPLPTGALGDLVVSGSALYFHNGTDWGAIS